MSVVYSKVDHQGHRNLYWCGDPRDADLEATVTIIKVGHSWECTVKERQLNG